MNPLVTLQNVSVVLGQTRILHDVCAHIGQGKITALIGLNGSGKTTLLRAILKEIPFEGTIRFHCGHDHRHPQPRYVGYVPQRLRLEGSFPITVRDLLAVSLSRRPLFFGIARVLEERMRKMMARVGAPASLLDHPMDKISGGEQQRVLLALALEPNPELLLLDEPAAGIDFKDQEGFYQLIERINTEQGVTVLLVSHDMSMVPLHAHHVVCLKDGHIQCEGAPSEIINPETLKRIFGAESMVYHHHHE